MNLKVVAKKSNPQNLAYEFFMGQFTIICGFLKTMQNMEKREINSQKETVTLASYFINQYCTSRLISTKT